MRKKSYSDMTKRERFFDFLLSRKKNLIAGFVLLVLAIAFRLAAIEAGEELKNKALLDIVIFFLTPCGFLWEWREYRKSLNE